MAPEQVLHAAIKQLAGFDFTKADGLDGTLFTLDLLTRAPLLQHALVSVLGCSKLSCTPADQDEEIRMKRGTLPVQTLLALENGTSQASRPWWRGTDAGVTCAAAHHLFYCSA